jgi:hypothetical protein
VLYRWDVSRYDTKAQISPRHPHVTVREMHMFLPG